VTIFLGLRTVIYPARDLAASKAWFTGLPGVEPYFDEASYVGFQVGGYELALDPAGDAASGHLLGGR
jgi:catechol 2,3-dioxygenase-like lactoylglutathione lyase family enzyme